MGNAFRRLPAENSSSILRIFSVPANVIFEACVAGPLPTMTAIVPGSKWSCLLLPSVLQDVFSEVLKLYPLLTHEGFFVDDMKLHVWGKSQ